MREEKAYIEDRVENGPMEATIGLVGRPDRDSTERQHKQNELDHWFSYHDNPSYAPKYESIRAAAKMLCEQITIHAPKCADRTTAIRTVREAVMWANAAIACDGW